MCGKYETPSEGRSVCDVCLGIVGEEEMSKWQTHYKSQFPPKQPEMKDAPLDEPGYEPEDPALVCAVHGPYEPWKIGKQTSRACPVCVAEKRSRGQKEANVKKRIAPFMGKSVEIAVSSPSEIETCPSMGEEVKIDSSPKIAYKDCVSQDATPGYLVTVDFSDCTDVLDWMRAYADKQDRTVEQQIRHLCRIRMGLGLEID